MNVTFIAPRLQKLAEHAGERLCLFVFEERHPLAGLTGAVDWRLHGHLSRLVIGGFLTGAEGERLLLPLGERLAPAHLVAIGLGPRAGFGAARADGALRRMFAAAAGLGPGGLVVALPGRPEQLADPAEAIAIFLAAHDALGGGRRVAIADTPAAQKAMLPVLERHRLKSGVPAAIA